MTAYTDDPLYRYFETAPADWCGRWALGWAACGRAVDMPEIRSVRDAMAMDVPALAALYAEKLGLSTKPEAIRGDIGLFLADHRFSAGFSHAVGISAGDGLWAFSMRGGVKFLRAEPVLVYG